MDLGIAWAIAASVLWVLSCWFICALAIAGLGVGVTRLVSGAPRATTEWIECFWAGTAAAILLLQLVHLALPIDDIAAGALLGVGLAVSATGLRGTVPRVTSCSRGSLLAAAAILCWLANQSGQVPIQWLDTGIYHLQGLAWVEQYPIIPGLAHLHGRLGFNNSSFLLAALLDWGPMKGQGACLLNGLLLAVLAVEGMLALERLRDGQGDRGTAAISAAGLSYALTVPWTAELPSLSTDLTCTVLLLAATVRLADSISNGRSEEQRTLSTALGIGLLAVACTVKASAALVAAFLLAGHALVARSMHRHGTHSRRGCVLGGSAGSVLAVTWALRSVVLSGYLIYPLAIARTAVSWVVPGEQAAAEAAWIADDVRYHAVVDLGASWTRWFPTYLADFATSVRGAVTLVLPAALCVILMVTASFPARRRSLSGDARTWLMIPVGLSAVVSMHLAPAPRFVTPQVWMLLALSGMTAIAGASPKRAVWGARGVVLTMCAATVGFWLHDAAPAGSSRVRRALHALDMELVVRPPHGEQPWVVPPLETFTTRSGLVVNVPATTGRFACYSAPLPCTPHPSAGLSLRDDGRIRSGFRLEGPWEPLNWPMPWGRRWLEYWRCTNTGLADEECWDSSAPVAPVEFESGPA